MKFIYLLIFASTLFACKKSSSSASTENTIEYRVSYTGMPSCTIVYQNEQQQPISLNALSGWAYSIKTSTKPFTANLYVQGIGNTSTTPITLDLKIFLNGNPVKSQSFTGVTIITEQIQYVVQ